MPEELVKATLELKGHLARLAGMKGTGPVTDPGFVGGVGIDPGRGSALAELSREDIEQIVTQVGETVSKLTGHTEARISSMVRKLRDAEKGGARTGMSRSTMLKILAEIVQELRQPLAVVMSVIDAVNAGMLGELSARQGPMFRLMASSASRLDILITKLADISGMPDYLSPDAKIINAVYGDHEGGGERPVL